MNPLESHQVGQFADGVAHCAETYRAVGNGGIAVAEGVDIQVVVAAVLQPRQQIGRAVHRLADAAAGFKEAGTVLQYIPRRAGDTARDLCPADSGVSSGHPAHNALLHRHTIGNHLDGDIVNILICSARLRHNQ